MHEEKTFNKLQHVWVEEYFLPELHTKQALLPVMECNSNADGLIRKTK